ncbi:MAG TPA: EboA domain-containing protein [Polyangiaceae bacterium]|nr:EboA domain-containing protein [Polyangiaceae bacterium]
MSTDDVATALEAFLREVPAAGLLLDRGRSVSGGPKSPAFRALFASAARRPADQVLPSGPIPAALIPAFRPHQSLVDLVRAALLARALEPLADSARTDAVLGLFERGELGEQESVLRTLELLPQPDAYVEVAKAACRTNARSVFEAIACENPFPARRFAEASFNQMVLKAVFLGVPVTRIEGLAARRTPELVRMALDYASERRAAGRVVPEDIARIVQSNPSSGA